MGGFNLLSVKATRTPTTGENRQLVYSSLFFLEPSFFFTFFFYRAELQVRWLYTAGLKERTLDRDPVLASIPQSVASRVHLRIAAPALVRCSTPGFVVSVHFVIWQNYYALHIRIHRVDHVWWAEAGPSEMPHRKRRRFWFEPKLHAKVFCFVFADEGGGIPSSNLAHCNAPVTQFSESIHLLLASCASIFFFSNKTAIIKLTENSS